ncbi:hypothetical protein IAT38_004434 [Cryptococcus sp. DSM 104549]
MPKASSKTSSATAGTRKKHAKKAGKDTTDDVSAGPSQQPHKKQRGEKKLSKAQKKALPKIKQYIPPPKPPAPPIPDPLDGQGLARTLPAELVVVLRRLGKKDDVTRRKGLEELREGWVSDLMKTGGTEEEEIEREIKEVALLSALPVWMHNLASFFQSPFHRSTAIQLHTEILSVPALRTSILETITLGLLPSTQNRDVLGSWMVAALEEGRRAGGSGLKGWDASTVWKPSSDTRVELADGDERIDLTQHLASLVEYLSLSILDPATLHDNIHPAPVSVAPEPYAPIPKKGANKGGKSKAPPTPVSRQPAQTPAAEDEELVEERLARYRVGGLVGLTWLLQQLPKAGISTLPDDLLSLLRNPALWVALSPEPVDNSESPGGLGTALPPIRRAGYALLAILVESFEAVIGEEETLKMVAHAVLGSCWSEKEAAVWETAGSAVARFLRKWPEAWTVTTEAVSRGSKPEKDGEEDEDNDDEDEDSDDDDEDGTDDHNGAHPATTLPDRSSPHYASFLEFTSTICPSIPHLTYPLLLVVISTLPPSLLLLSPGPSLQVQNLFSHLWSPVDSRLLSTHSLPGQQSGFQSFQQAVLDCTIFLIGKSWSAEDGKGTAAWLVKDQLGERAWKDGVLALGGKAGGRRVVRGVGGESEAAAFGQALARLAAIDEQLLASLAEVLRSTTLEACFPAQGTDEKAQAPSILPRSLVVLSAVRDATDVQSVVNLAGNVIGDVAKKGVDRLEESLEVGNSSAVVITEMLVEVLRQYSQLMDEGSKEKLVIIVQTSSAALLASLSPALYISLVDLLSANVPAESQGTCAETLLSLLGSTDVDAASRFAVASSLLSLPTTTLLHPGSLDPIITEATQSALATNSPAATNVVTSSLSSLSYISPSAVGEVLTLTCATIHSSTEKLLTTSFDSLNLPRAAFEIFAAYAVDHLAEVVASDEWAQALVSVHHVIFMLPRVPGHIETAEAKVESLGKVWAKLGELGEEEKAKVLAKVHEALRNEIERVEVHVDPSVLIDVALATTIGTTTAPPVKDLAATLLPPAQKLLDQLSSHASLPPHLSLPITDPLIPYTPPDDEDTVVSSGFDTLGRSQAARGAEAAVALLRADRHLVRSEPALLQVALAAVQLAQDALAVPGASRGLYDKDMSILHLATLVREVEGAVSFALGFVDEVPLAWHAATVAALKTGKLPVNADLLQRLLAALKDDVVARGGDVGAGEKEGEAWLTYAMGSIDRAPQLSLAIILAIKPIMLDTPPFTTAQNRLASALTTIPPSKAHTALPLLRVFIASAPPSDAASVFLPQQRALFVLRHVAGWLTSDDVDEDLLPEDMEYRVMEMERAVAPIVQDLSGGHWDGIFDLVENGLEGSSLDDPSTFCLLHQSLTLLQQIRDLCQTNKSLRASWVSKDTHMKLVLEHFLQCRTADTVPLQYIQGLILDLLQDVPEKVMENASLEQLVTLISQSTSSPVQTAAYRILSRVINHQTLALVLEVEASVADAEDGKKSREIVLSKELMSVVREGLGVDWHASVDVSMVLAQLLAWMSILDYFEDASRTLRWTYLDQLNTSKLITDGLIPMLFAILGVSEMGAWNFPASQYAVDEFYPELLDPEDLSDLSPLASHLFYRALVTIPSSLRSYYESLKDRQLSMSMLTFTARHFSPIIIAHEFSALREPSAMATLTEEGLNVRIAQGGGASVAANGAGSAEAIASYVVDEQPMEIGIRLPAEFPLKGVDVRDLRRVGVPENKWRGWLMSVQQTITSRNGLILEALTVFKKNVVLHFEGVVECAICYSIISLTDRTLPTKPCRTCKNRFHASCLFKWFNSSHSSSCPMCRSLF